jgi:hypothetical protein
MIIPNTKGNLEKCICRDCPTYNKCMGGKGEGLFCARGKSDCNIEEDECLCEQCPIDAEYKLTARFDLMEKKILKLNQFYCMKGAAGTTK